MVGKTKKTRYPEIASLWSGCGGRTRTCDLRVMSTRNVLRKCHGSQEKADFPNKTRRPDADGLLRGRQNKGFAAAASAPNSQTFVGNPTGDGGVSGSFGRPNGETRITETTRVSQKSQNPRRFSLKLPREEIALKFVRQHPDNRCIERWGGATRTRAILLRLLH